jgi:hypothetical protein
VYFPLGIAPVNLTAILILTSLLRSHLSIPIRIVKKEVKKESHVGQREMTGKNIIGKVSQKAERREKN